MNAGNSKCDFRTGIDTPDIKKHYLQPLSRANDKAVIIIGGRQFTFYDDKYAEENINITEGYLWFIQYNNNKRVSLQDFQLFMISSCTSNEVCRGLISTNRFFDNAVDYLGISLDSIPQIGFRVKTKLYF